jgi:hypothetical protein
MQVLNPLAILDVALAPWHMLQVGVPGAVSRKYTVRVMKGEKSSIGVYISYQKNNRLGG